MKSGQISPAVNAPAPSSGIDVAPFASSLEHILAEIGWVDLLVRLELENPEHAAGSGAALKGLVISDQEVADLLQASPGSPPFATGRRKADCHGLSDAARDLRTTNACRRDRSLARGMSLRLVDLQRAFSLSELDLQCLTVCLAVEIDRRYEKLFAYLQDDVTSKYASVDLVLNLLCQSLLEKFEARERLAAGSPLLQHGLLWIVDDGPQSAKPFLGRALRMDERIVRYLLGSDEPDARVAEFAVFIAPQKSFQDLLLQAEMKLKLEAVLATYEPSPGPFVHLCGSQGYERRAIAEALCHDAGQSLVHVDLDILLSSHAGDASAFFKLAVREAMLRASAVYIDGFEHLLPEEKAGLRRSLLKHLDDVSGLIFLASETIWHPRDELGGRAFISVPVHRANFSDRMKLWRTELGAAELPEEKAQELANKFQLSEGQIRDAVRSARQLARWRDPASDQISSGDLYEACRIHSSRSLSALGRKIKPHYKWDDLVLPEDRTQQLREICNCVKHRSLVFDTWGFERKQSLGKGLNMLFSGPSGTGKTMAAEVMAGEVGLDIYKIDLSTIVSKYIGETEKNLARIFSEAESSNAILFFDEADALFGKRSEVRDSHDRYANIEINYLLQKMEEHEGVVILATNFRKNMDDAFVRRLHFSVEFPLPSEADRIRIWERIWPEETPQAPDLDFDYMARKFELPGGNIRNVAMAAAFLAASNGGVVTMKHLLHGTRREYQKMGRIVSQGEFQ